MREKKPKRRKKRPLNPPSVDRGLPETADTK